MAGLNFDFFGDTRILPDESISEQEFLLDVDEEGKRYKVLGFIDKLFLYKSAGAALIRDFKTSKSVFKGKDLTDNLQDLIYCLAVKRMFPEYSKRIMEFLFLKFNLESKGTVKMPQVSDDELEGLEYELTGIQILLPRKLYRERCNFKFCRRSRLSKRWKFRRFACIRKRWLQNE